MAYLFLFNEFNFSDSTTRRMNREIHYNSIYIAGAASRGPRQIPGLGFRTKQILFSPKKLIIFALFFNFQVFWQIEK
ncbi:hypothetical protein BpHYR1_010074 [Brachionus plicatilis]|uniref:Uncharacterized protein n=1 Tax=Brachionus plicatilis TaxID=10195 RepID=A0A3M7QT20_BRAPC|nr:hypothetical protein BpHYR1_010074 [Brachionus plicatilis]